MANAIDKDGLSLVAGTDGSQKADLVFVHGFTGDARTTWESPTADKSFWPEWLAEDFPGLAVWSFGYESTVIHWLKDADSLENLAASALALLQAKGLGERPLLFVTHSLGGIVVKHMIDAAVTPPNGEYTNIAEKTSGIEFIAVPHRGTKIVDHWLILIRAIWAQHKDLEKIRWADDALMQLHKRFISFRTTKEGSLYIRSFCEKKKLGIRFSIGTKQIEIPTPIMVVDKISANPEFQEFPPLLIDEDHIGICKPPDRKHRTYILTKEFVKQSLVRVGIEFYDDQGGESYPSDADRSALIKSLMGPQVEPEKLGKCPNGGQALCLVRTNSVYLISELDQTLGAILETQRFLNHCSVLQRITYRIITKLAEVKPDEVSKAIQSLWRELRDLVSFFKNLERYHYLDEAGDDDNWRDKPLERMEAYYDRRVLHMPDARDENKILKPLMRDMWTVYVKLSKLENEKKAWPERVNAITTDETYMGPVDRFSRQGKKVIARLEGLRNGRFKGTSTALEHGFASPNLFDLPGCYIRSIREMPHSKYSEIPRPRKDSTKS